MSSPDGFRYERKFEVETPDPVPVRTLLLRHPAMFRTVFPPRWINNIYLDTPLLGAYVDTVEGNPNRAKARIRWYGEFFRDVPDGVLEVKVKQGAVGSKGRFAVPPFSTDQALNGRTLAALIRGIDGLPGWARAVVDGLEEPTANRYRRQYFLSGDGRFRATIDSDLTFFAVGLPGGGFRKRPFVRPGVVLEVKYGIDAEADADRVCSWFPYRIARHSKYARGVQAAAPWV
jgi:hypothetical protein